MEIKKTPQQMFEEKQKSIAKYVDKKQLNISIWASIHDATDLAIARLAKERKTKASLDTHIEYEIEIKYWLDFLFKLSQDKQEYEEIPIVEETKEIRPLANEQIKEPDEEEFNQEIYDEKSGIDDNYQSVKETENL